MGLSSAIRRNLRRFCDALSGLRYGNEQASGSVAGMYHVDSQDQVVEIKDVPQSSVGAPCPMILAGEHTLLLAYYLEDVPDDWDGKSVRVVDENTLSEPCALVRFKMPYAHFFGPPNDEAFDGHPLAARGLSPYRVYEIRNSSWIRLLALMNSVHPYHDDSSFKILKHCVFAFHDTTFECVARDFTIGIETGSIVSVLESALQEIRN